ncbi:MAG: ATP-dependent Clp protease adaptor ClpS [Treponemataceae bacterium]
MSIDSQQDTKNYELVITDTDVTVDVPAEYNVIFYNDDFTPMEFVVDVLQEVFQKSAEQAHALMLAVHTKGSAIVAVYPFDIAATRVRQVKRIAEEQQYPLRCEMEEV